MPRPETDPQHTQGAQGYRFIALRVERRTSPGNRWPGPHLASVQVTNMLFWIIAQLIYARFYVSIWISVYFRAAWAMGHPFIDPRDITAVVDQSIDLWIKENKKQ
jgi:hypothetical protein